MQSGDVFPEDIELEVDDSAHFDITEVRVLKGVGDDCHLEGVGGGVADGERDTVHRHTAFIHGEIALLRHLPVLRIFKREVGAAVGIRHRDAIQVAVSSTCPCTI